MQEKNIFEIKTLINDIEINLDCYKIIRKHINKIRKIERWLISFIIEDDIPYFILIARNHMFSSILTLNSLLTKGKKEISIYNKIDLSKTLKTELDKIKNEFTKKKLNELRHEVVAHKIKSDELYLLTCFETLEKKFKDINKIYNQLNGWLKKNFKDTNDELFEKSYSQEIGKIIRLVEEDKMKGIEKRIQFHRKSKFSKTKSE
jgi:hypothetical protein